MNLQTIVDLNNQAVAFLKQNQFQNAISAASCALKCQKQFQVSNVGLQQTDDGASDKCTNDCCIDDCMMYCDVQELQCTLGATEFLYRQGISLPSNGIDSASVTAIIVFNLALSHHLLSQQDQGPKSQYYLRKAKRMYELAHNAKSSEENVLFQFAVINNCAVISKAFGDLAMANACLEYLLSLLMVFVDRGCSMELRHVHGFLANLNATEEIAPAA